MKMFRTQKMYLNVVFIINETSFRVKQSLPLSSNQLKSRLKSKEEVSPKHDVDIVIVAEFS